MRVFKVTVFFVLSFSFTWHGVAMLDDPGELDFIDKELDTTGQLVQMEEVSGLEGVTSEINTDEKMERLPASRRKKVQKFRVRKKRAVVPKARTTIKKIERQVIKIAEPPSQFRKYFEVGTDEAELESTINKEIQLLFKLLKTDKRRSLRLRLGSLYIEKSRLIEYRLYEKYDQEMRLFEQRKRKTKPRINLRSTYLYINKAIKLFETYRRQFPKDRNMDRVLFFLGVAYFKKGQLDKGRDRYEDLIKRFPKSAYINDVQFELGEYYFNKSRWKKAAFHYRKIATNRKLRLYSFALYKLAWCRLKMGQTNRAIANLEAVIREGARQQMKKSIGAREAGRVHFASEALGDLVLFYSQSKKTPVGALPYFQKMSGSATRALKMLKELAYIYLDYGNLRGVRVTFKQLIEEDPESLMAYDYQYQIIRAYTYAGDRKIFLKELKDWIVRYGPGSAWARENRRQEEAIKKAFNLMETTVRNYALRMHQSYRKTKGPVSKTQALFSYELYNNHFGKFKKAHEMRFFYAELLFDLKKYNSAARQYLYLVEHFPKSKYYETANLNSVLTFEKTLPSSGQIRKIVGKKVSRVPFTQPIHNFQKVANMYVNRFPKSSNVPAILYKMASLHYEFNHHKEALAQFWYLIKKYPSSKYTEYSANLILDIYNLTKDFKGLRQAAKDLLANKMIANSGSAREIRKILSQISLKSAEDMAKNKEYFKSARLYKDFADTHPRSPLRGTAYYNSGINFKKSGDTLSAISLYKMALQSGGGGKIKSTVLKDMPMLYQKTGQYRKAAEAFSLYARSFPKDKSTADFWFNAALIYDGLNRYTQAEQAYLEYFKRSKKAEKTQALYLLAELKKRRGQATQAVSYYNQFLNRGSSDKKALVEAAFRIAEIKKTRGEIKASKTWYRRTVNLYRKNQAGVFYAAQAQFYLIYDTYVQFIKIRIPANPKRQQQVVQKKLNLFNKLKEDLKQVIRFDSGYQVVASLVLIGLASEHIGDAIYNSPLPKGLNKEEIKQYKDGLKKTALPFQKEAVKNYKLAVSRSRKMNAYNKEWLTKAVVRLSDLEKDSVIAVNPLLRKKVLPLFLYDWSGG
ncbi:MAG: tetratricopeptide repeat protein [Bdellovibrionales bacterium]|nr:tetratricopeptide repeat protein [Bdellovibrionales bacterium]